MKTILKHEFTVDKYLPVDEKNGLFLEIDTQQIVIPVPMSEPENEVVIYTPEEYMEFEEKLLAQLPEIEKKLKKIILGEDNGVCKG